jgi:hypothetical protein
MAQERRFERDQFRGDDRPEDRQDWNYGRGRESWRGHSEEGDWPERSYYGRGRETGYGEFYGRGRESRFGSGAGYRTGYPGEAGEKGGALPLRALFLCLWRAGAPWQIDFRNHRS